MALILREGSNHTIYFNKATNQISAVGRHKELDDLLCQKICKQLGIKPINKDNGLVKSDYRLIIIHPIPWLFFQFPTYSHRLKSRLHLLYYFH